MIPILAVTDVVLTGLMVAVTGAITAIINAWMAHRNTNALNKSEEDRKRSDAERAKESAASEVAAAARADELKKAVDAKTVVDGLEFKELVGKVNATHDIVNSRMDEFKKVLQSQSEKTLEDFKGMLAKAAAFDSATMKSAGEIIANTPTAHSDDPANVKQVSK